MFALEKCSFQRQTSPVWSEKVHLQYNEIALHLLALKMFHFLLDWSAYSRSRQKLLILGINEHFLVLVVQLASRHQQTVSWKCGAQLRILHTLLRQCGCVYYITVSVWRQWTHSSPEHHWVEQWTIVQKDWKSKSQTLSWMESSGCRDFYAIHSKTFVCMNRIL